MFQDSMAQPDQDDRYSGIRILWIRVIQRAIFDWVSYQDSTIKSKKSDAKSAYKFLFTDKDGLDYLCDVLCIDKDKFRHRASTMTKDEITKIEHLERTPHREEEEDVEKEFALEDDDKDDDDSDFFEENFYEARFQ